MGDGVGLFGCRDGVLGVVRAGHVSMGEGCVRGFFGAVYNGATITFWFFVVFDRGFLVEDLGRYKVLGVRCVLFEVVSLPGAYCLARLSGVVVPLMGVLVAVVVYPNGF